MPQQKLVANLSETQSTCLINKRLSKFSPYMENKRLAFSLAAKPRNAIIQQQLAAEITEYYYTMLSVV